MAYNYYTGDPGQTVDPAEYNSWRQSVLYPTSDPNMAFSNVLLDLGVPLYNPIVQATAPALSGGLMDAFLVNQAMNGYDPSQTSAEAVKNYETGVLTDPNLTADQVISQALMTTLGDPALANNLRSYYTQMGLYNTAGSTTPGSGSGSSGGSDIAWKQNRDQWVSDNGYSDHNDAASSLGMTNEEFDNTFKDSSGPSTRTDTGATSAGSALSGGASAVNTLTPGGANITTTGKSADSGAAVALNTPTAAQATQQYYNAQKPLNPVSTSVSGGASTTSNAATRQPYGTAAAGNYATTPTTPTPSAAVPATNLQPGSTGVVTPPSDLSGTPPTFQPSGVTMGQPYNAQGSQAQGNPLMIGSMPFNPYAGDLFPLLYDPNFLTDFVYSLTLPLLGAPLASAAKNMTSMGTVYGLRTMGPQGDFLSSIFGV